MRPRFTKLAVAAGAHGGWRNALAREVFLLVGDVGVGGVYPGNGRKTGGPGSNRLSRSGAGQAERVHTDRHGLASAGPAPDTIIAPSSGRSATGWGGLSTGRQRGALHCRELRRAKLLDVRRGVAGACRGSRRRAVSGRRQRAHHQDADALRFEMVKANWRSFISGALSTKVSLFGQRAPGFRE
jgi:hypothetical protein